MITTQFLLTPTQFDLAGYCHPDPNLWQIQQRIQTLIQRYLSPEVLCDRIADLPNQLPKPKTASVETYSLFHTLYRMTQVLHWEAWSFNNQVSFLGTFVIALRHIQSWTRTLTPDYLNGLLGIHPGHLKQ